MPKQQDRSASTAKANSQPDQANASSNAAASKDSEILKAIVKPKAEIREDSRQNMGKLSHEINASWITLPGTYSAYQSGWMRRSPGSPSWRAGLKRWPWPCARVWRSGKVFSKRLLIWNQGHRETIFVYSVCWRGEKRTRFHNSWAHLQIPEDFDMKI